MATSRNNWQPDVRAEAGPLVVQAFQRTGDSIDTLLSRVEALEASVAALEARQIVLVDTHANRLDAVNYPQYQAGILKLGTLFYETDLDAFYLVTLAAGVHVWTVRP